MHTYESAQDAIDALTDDYHYERIPHPVGSEYVAVFKSPSMFQDATGYSLVTENGEVITTSWENDKCDGCENNEDYTPGRGTPYKTANRKRRAANCKHANVAADAFHLDSDGACAECGSYGVRTNDLREPHLNEVVIVEENCIECGTLRST